MGKSPNGILYKQYFDKVYVSQLESKSATHWLEVEWVTFWKGKEIFSLKNEETKIESNKILIFPPLRFNLCFPQTQKLAKLNFLYRQKRKEKKIDVVHKT